jgi:hypothetical protein
MSTWTLFSNHGHVLFCLSRDPEARLRDVAADVGITERAVQKIVRDLQDGGMVSVSKSGRRNCYKIHKKQPLRHELEATCTLDDLIAVVNQGQAPEQPARSRGGEAGQASVARSATKPRVPVAAAETEPQQAAAQASAETHTRPPATAPAAGSEQAGEKPEPDKPAAEEKTGRKSRESSNNLEKQQGSLF